MTKFTKIYLDLDGVIADFEKRFYELYGMSPKDAEARKQFGNNFQKLIDDKHFSTLDLMPDALDLLQYLKHQMVPVEILSSTARESVHNAVSFQKDVWLQKQGISYPRNFVPGKQHKPKFADENSVLIDDTKSIIDAWNKAGGIGIHHTDALTTISILDVLLRA